MPISIDRDDVQRLFRQKQAQLVEVLPADEFNDEHLPGAVSLPLTKFTSSELAKLDKNRPVIVYCWDYQ